LAVWTSDPSLGARLQQWGLFTTPEERDPPAILDGLGPKMGLADPLHDDSLEPIPLAAALSVTVNPS
jgi:membrane glycosyltransferase